MNVLQSTQAFKLTCFLDEIIKKFKACISSKEDQQIEDINLFESYTPVVQWTAIHLMLIFEVLLELKSKIIAAFLHATLEEGENIFVEMPLGFRRKARC